MRRKLSEIFVAAIAELLVAFARVLAGTAVRYADCTPSTLTAQSIFFSNHTSHLDFVVLWSSLPRSVRTTTRPVAAADYWGRGPVRRLLAQHVFCAVLVKRGSEAQSDEAKAENAEALRKALAAGHSLILFPEGTRGDGYTVGHFRNGLYRLAQQWPQVQLVPVRLENLNRILPKGETLPVPLLSRLTFGPVMALHEGEAMEKFLERARDAVMGDEEARVSGVYES
jgi:1-acyl-sn-glycerol-3-phosphate acyltransferase